MPPEEWIERDKRERQEADLGEGRAIDAIASILVLICLVLFAHALIRMV